MTSSSPSATKAAISPSTYDSSTTATQTYYNSSSASLFYQAFWGGAGHINVGTHNSPSSTVSSAALRTVEKMGELCSLDPSSRVLDLGSGYGAAARYLVKTYGCRVTCLNLAEEQNDICRKMNADAVLGTKIEVVEGSFESVPFPDGSFDVVWSQDAFLHAGDRGKVVGEMARVLKPGGRAVFSDIMVVDGADVERLRPNLVRLKMEERGLGTPGFYLGEMRRVGFGECEFLEDGKSMGRHFEMILRNMERAGEDVKRGIEEEYLESTRMGYASWAEGVRDGTLTWGIFRGFKG